MRRDDCKPKTVYLSKKLTSDAEANRKKFDSKRFASLSALVDHLLDRYNKSIEKKAGAGK